MVRTQAPTGTVVQLRGLTITRGRAAAGDRGNHGGGIYNSTVLTLTGVAIAGNTATFFGGGIFNEGGSTVTVGAGSQVTGNTAVDFR